MFCVDWASSPDGAMASRLAVHNNHWAVLPRCVRWLVAFWIAAAFRAHLKCILLLPLWNRRHYVERKALLGSRSRRMLNRDGRSRTIHRYSVFVVYADVLAENVEFKRRVRRYRHSVIAPRRILRG